MPHASASQLGAFQQARKNKRRNKSFCRVQEQGENAKGFADATEHVCRADVAGAGAAQVNAFGFGDEQAVWNGTEQVGAGHGQ